jgi:hypothetical protein
MLWVPMIANAQQCCASKEKLKVKEVANKKLMNDLM